MAPGELVRAFVAHAKQPPSSPAVLESILVEILQGARAAWPGVAVAPERFMRALAESVGDGPSESALEAVHASDLYLACALGERDPTALAAFEQYIVPEVRSKVLMSLGDNLDLADEVIQRVRHKLFIGETEATGARIGDYAAQGPLLAWTKMVAIRIAIDARRSEQRELSLDEEIRQIAPSDEDLEGDYLGKRYAAEIQQALQLAFSSLEVRERNVLRLYFLDELTLQQIAASHQVAHSTVSRWIADAREKLVRRARQHVQKRLELRPSEVESLMRSLRSHLDFSLRTLFRTRP